MIEQDDSEAVPTNHASVLVLTLEVIVRRRLQEAWLLENIGAIQTYNNSVEHNGVYSDGVRCF